MKKADIKIVAWIVVVIWILPVASLTAQQRTFDLRTASIADIQHAVAAGALTYERLVQLYLNRIEAYDQQGPKLNAVLEIHPRALEIARELDEERRTSGIRSPLHGIPIAVKDVVDVHDIPSAGGNLALKGTYPQYDATVIQKLRDAGAIIFFKANLDEFNLGSQGISSIGGQVLNPYDLSRNPGGSSAGPGVSVNVAFATLGVATETGASIRSPASNNSLVGIAPSQGLVSRAGVIAISYTQDRIGVHAKSVADAATMLFYMRGFDAEDLFTWESLGKLDPRPYTDYLDDDGLVGARLGVFRDLFRQGERFAEINGLIEAEIDSIRRQGAVVIDGLTTGMDLVKFFPQARASVQEFRFVFNAYLKRRRHSCENVDRTDGHGKISQEFGGSVPARAQRRIAGLRRSISREAGEPAHDSQAHRGTHGPAQHRCARASVQVARGAAAWNGRPRAARQSHQRHHGPPSDRDAGRREQ